MTGVDNILKSLIIIESNLVEYNTHVFKTKAIPIICRQVNSLLDRICRNHRQLTLECVYNDDNIKFNWFIKDGVNTVPYQKGSGFQKFAVSLAMRIVIGKLGISGIRSNQLFIDEGFSSFDADNLANVPEFLEELMENCGYDMVMIVTHIDELKCAFSNNNFITIGRDDAKGVSFLRY